jgi:hypothetical protein
MPKTEIDYSNTIIYKITCKDPEIKDVYVGHTTNFVQRKHAHKQSCNNQKSSNYDCKLYNTMREKGGWSNWKMEIINFFNCRDHYEARQKEQEYFVSLNATLNSIEPMPKPKEHPKINETISNEQFQSTTNKFSCESCHFKCNKQSNYDKHLTTLKHTNTVTLNKLEPENAEIYNKPFTCKKCQKIYKARNSLWYHEKQCISTITDTIDPNSIMQIIQQNDVLKTLLIDQNKMIIEQHNKILEFYKHMGNNITNLSPNT